MVVVMTGRMVTITPYYAHRPFTGSPRAAAAARATIHRIRHYRLPVFTIHRQAGRWCV